MKQIAPSRDALFHDALSHLRRNHLDLVVEIKALRLYLALRRYAETKANFNPYQPRIPRGNHDGGQWTTSGSGGSDRTRATPQGQPRLIPARAEAAPTEAKPSALHWTAERVREAWQRIDAWAEHFIPGGVDTALAAADEFNRLLFRFGGEESLRAYDRTSQKFSEDIVEAYNYEVNRAVSQGRMTRQQADDTTVIVMAVAAIRGRTAKRPRISAKPKGLRDWQKSETHLGAKLRTSPQAESYKNGQKVQYGTQGSVRPDLCVGSTCTFEIKNYNISKNISGLVYNAAKQARARKEHLPKGMTQKVAVDVTGQKVSATQELAIKQGIERSSGGVAR